MTLRIHTPPVKPRCENCRFWRKAKRPEPGQLYQSPGECRRRPPPFPEAEKSDWCGEYEKKNS